MIGKPQVLGARRGVLPGRCRAAGLLLAAFLFAALFAAAQDSVAPASSPRVGWIRLHDAIQPASAGFFERALHWAEDERLACLVVELDTPGGLDTSMRQMVKAILSADVAVVVYVAPSGSRAASAGLFLAYAAHVAAMAPGTNIGAAHPVSIGGGFGGGDQQPDTTMIAKVTNDAVAYLRSLAERGGRNSEWAEEAVRRSVSVSAEEALDLGVIDLIAEDAADLLATIDGREVQLGEGTQVLRTRGAALIRREADLRDRILGTIANPNIAYLLLLLGGLGLFFEFSHPGTLFPGIVGAVCLLLAIFGLQMLPVRTAGIALLVLAIILFILEIKVTSYGALSIGGVAALLFGSLMLFERGPRGVNLSLGVVFPAVAVVGGLFIFGAVMAIRAHGARARTGREGLIGEIGEALGDLTPRGRIFVHGEIWNARSATPVGRGAAVRVLAVRRMELQVVPHEEPPS